MMPMMIANVAIAGGLTALLYKSHGWVIVPWFALVAATSAVRFCQVLVSLRSPERSRSSAELHRIVAQAILMGLIFNGVPSWLLTQTTGLTFTIIVCQLTGLMWAGSLILATVATAAVCYVVLTVGLISAGFLASGFSLEHLYLVALFVAGGATALRSAVQQHHAFASDQLRQLDLQANGEVIGLLLKDYEEQTSDWLWETDAEHRYRRPSERFQQACNKTASEIREYTLDTLLIASEVAGNDEAHGKLRAFLAEGRSFRDLVIPFATDDGVRWWSISGRPLIEADGTFAGYRGVCADVTAAKKAEARLAHLAHHDGLTNLPNRSFFEVRLQHALQVSDHDRLAVLSLDLDGFKAVNDRHGHPIGDALLIAVSGRLLKAVTPGDVVARFGGDEFTVLVTNLSGADEMETICQRLIDRLTEGFVLQEADVTVGVSIGVAFAGTDGETPEKLLKNADSALYRAKLAGRGTYRFFSPDADFRLQERQQIMQDLRAALGRDEFTLYFQPYVSSESGEVAGCEALLRWFHPVRGLVSPVEFIPLAEESGLIVPLGAWVLEQACLEAVRWPPHLRVSVNISPIQFRDRSLPHTIMAALTRSGLAPSRLEVEVTETTLMEDSHSALDILRHIRALGMRIALDDFGTGYSSLSYLRRFPFDKVKIDRSFVQELSSRQDSQVIVRAIRDIAKGLGMTITAEGDETTEQALQLKETGCEELQGFLYSKPRLPEHLGLRYGEQVADVPLYA